MGDAAAMTREYRDWLRQEIDKARRARLSRARTGEPTTSKRTQYWAEYSRRNRKRIRAQQRARRVSDV